MMFLFLVEGYCQTTSQFFDLRWSLKTHFLKSFTDKHFPCLRKKIILPASRAALNNYFCTVCACRRNSATGQVAFSPTTLTIALQFSELVMDTLRVSSLFNLEYCLSCIDIDCFIFPLHVSRWLYSRLCFFFFHFIFDLCGILAHFSF